MLFGARSPKLKRARRITCLLCSYKSSLAVVKENRVRTKVKRQVVSVLVMSTIPKRKHKRSDIEAYYRNETETFWCVLKKEVERLCLVQNLWIEIRTFWCVPEPFKSFFLTRSFFYWKKNQSVVLVTDRLTYNYSI